MEGNALGERTFLRKAGGRDSKSASDILLSRAIAYEASL
jgi:hypothetical protein